MNVAANATSTQALVNATETTLAPTTTAGPQITIDDPMIVKPDSPDNTGSDGSSNDQGEDVLDIFASTPSPRPTNPPQVLQSRTVTGRFRATFTYIPENYGTDAAFDSTLLAAIAYS